MATASKTATKTTKPLPLGTQIDEFWELREKKRKIEATLKDIDGQLATAESELMERMQAEGTEKATGAKGSISITSSIKADVLDWDAFYAYIGKNKFWHLLQKRVSDPAYRELLDHGKKVPGVQPFNAKRLNLRSVA